MRLSYWEQQSLLGKPDVIIIGAGIVGLTAARCIAQAHPALNVTVFEGQLIGALASSRNAGFACFGSVSELISDIATYGEDKVVELLSMRREGLSLLVKNLGAKTLNYHEVGGYEVFDTQEAYQEHHAHIAPLNKLLGQNVFEAKPTPSPLRFYGQAILNKAEGHIDTGRMYDALYSAAVEAGVKIFNGIKVSNYHDEGEGISVTLEGIEVDLTCERLLITNNALAQQLLPDLEVSPCRNQVMITTPIANHGLSGTFHLDQGYVYFRDVGDRVLIGGGRHRFPEEEVDTLGVNQPNLNYLQDLLRDQILPADTQFEIDTAWSGVLTGGSNRLPIVKKVSANISVAVRLGGMGVAIGSIIGQEVATLAFD